MASFHPLKIKDIRKETNECVSIAFDVPAHLKEEFIYKQGQYITLKVNVHGEELRRSYSLCSSPVADDELRIAVKAIEKGKVSNFLNNGIEQGSTLEVMKPMGNFYVDMPAPQPQHYVAFAAGSGITPVMSLLKTALATHPANKFTLIYGNRSSEQIIFRKELDALEATHGDRFKVLHVLSREKTSDPLFSGRIDAGKCATFLNQMEGLANANHYFVCGPFDMIEDVRRTLKTNGVEKERIHFELFSTPAPTSDTPPTGPEEKGTATESKVTIVLDGDETIITVTGNTSILDAALDAGLDAPYACTGGSCCTCRAKIMEGTAVMDVNYALTEKEVSQGYILTCQSHPTSPTMVVDYDQP